MHALAYRLGTGKALSQRFGLSLDQLKEFVTENRSQIQRIADGEPEPEPEKEEVVTPEQLDDLWITNKFQRLRRMQKVAEETEDMIFAGGMTPAELSTAIREFRSYLMLAANELGQLLHRGSGEAGTGDSLHIDIQGVDMETMR